MSHKRAINDKNTAKKIPIPFVAELPKRSKFKPDHNLRRQFSILVLVESARKDVVQFNQHKGFSRFNPCFSGKCPKRCKCIEEW